MKLLTIILGVLCLGQLWGTAVAIAIAATEIESIVVTGPIFTVLGLVVVLLGAIDGRMMPVWFGLSAGLVSLLIFVLINAKGWGPEPAAFPVTLILLGYELAVIPIGLLALYGIVSRPLMPSQVPRQFNLRSLLGLMLLAGVDLAIVRLAMHQGTTTLAVIAVGLGVAACLASVVVVVLAIHRRAVEPAPS
jgi:hypothetical protein